MPKPKGPGDLRDRVRFQRRTTTDDGYGNAVGAWVDLDVERSAHLVPTRGGEAVQAGRVAGVASWDCWVRYDSGTRTVQPEDRAVDVRNESRVFNVAFVGDMDGDRRWLLIQLTSGGAHG